MNLDYTEVNAQIIDQWVADGWEWGRAIDHETYMRAQKGQWHMLLTPVKPVPPAWYPPLSRAKVLGLACGGGQQMPIFAALGAKCTVMDYSPRQLESEHRVAEREGYAINIVRGDMTRPFPFPDCTFDLIFHPVSNCYIEDVTPVWRECHRVLKPGGVLMAGLDNGLSYAFDDDEIRIVRALPFNPLKDPALYQECLEKDWGVQFSHTIDEQIGGQLKAGFILTDVFQDTSGAGNLHDHNIPTFWATRAVKPE